MHLKKITIELDVSAIQHILAIDIDDDSRLALDFVKNTSGRPGRGKTLQPH